MDSTNKTGPFQDPKLYICEFCDRSFTMKSNMKRHVTRMHKSRRVKYGSMKCPFLSCEFWCESRRDLRVHLHEPYHNISFNCYKRTFKSMEDFLQWKAAEEEVTNTCFISFNKGYMRGNGVTPFYYVCHRSGFHYREEPSPMKRVKRMAKINGTCPAAIKVAVFQGKVNVVYHKTHAGHNFDMKYLKLRKFEKDYIAGKLLQGFSFDKILQDIKNDETLVGQRIKMVSRKDLHNIVKTYRVKLDRAEVCSDLKNIEEWTTQLKNFSSSPILIYKPHGLWYNHLNLYKKDFMLSIMTEGQKQVLEMLPQSVVWINCLLNSNLHGFFLVTVCIIDQSGMPFPIAYCFTNRNDGAGIKAFLNSIKNRVGRIKATLLISDHSEAYLSAWTFVMGAPAKHAFYFPHLQHHWKKNLRKITGAQEKQERIYELLVALSKAPNFTEFEHLLKTFVNQIRCDNDLKEFGSYFESNFLNKTNVWAFCHYISAGLPTIAHLEEIDKEVNDICFHDDLPKGVDLSIRELLLMTHEKVYEQITSLYRGTEFLEQIITQNHKNNEQLYSCDIEYISDSVKWRIKTCDDESMYSVQKRSTRNPGKKELYCPLCKVFLDSYFCNCVDFLIMCKICEHVHAVACASETPCEVVYVDEGATTAPLEKKDNEVVISCKETVDFSNAKSHADLTVANFEVVV